MQDRPASQAKRDRNQDGWPIHPFLFAAASVLGLYALNVKEAALVEILPALGLALGFALLVVLVLSLLSRSFGARTAILSSIVLIGCLFTIRFAFWGDQAMGGVPMVPVMAGFVLILLVAFVAVARTRRDLRLPHSILNGVALILVVTPIWQAASYKWEHGRPGLVAPAPEEAAAPAAVQPDIYYLVFDRYASAAVMERYFGSDDTPLEAFLEERGFYVARGSHANYLKTGHSLASTFQMDYLDFLADEEGRHSSDWQPIVGMLRDHRVARFLKTAGYRYAQIGAWWGPTQVNDYAEFNPRFGFTEFTAMYLRDRVISPLMHLVAPDSFYTRTLQWDAGQCQRVPWQIEQIKQAADGAAPTFVFGHILLPHEPFVFDADGNCLSQEEADARGRVRGYVEQVRYASKVIRDLVTALQQREGPPPIIIIQADEGPFPETDVGFNRSWREATFDELQIKMGILNAYYFPDGDYGLLYPTITPVNSFRMLFGKYFGSNLERLPDRIYAFPDIFGLYDFFDVTAVVRQFHD
ncbi:sulfatase-like hydrolase/transferase [Geminicoccus flavidas]|uniref:sulfatase-like hydrolase/transferase n=1 Tax=Geminicoccus flavidas TaxID=2506407 RepID=UPI0013593380|nr:sulfatase-like hydrolase/transferase [Geminicoccus flavidas]